MGAEMLTRMDGAETGYATEAGYDAGTGKQTRTMRLHQHFMKYPLFGMIDRSTHTHTHTRTHTHTHTHTHRNRDRQTEVSNHRA